MRNTLLPKNRVKQKVLLKQVVLKWWPWVCTWPASPLFAGRELNTLKEAVYLSFPVCFGLVKIDRFGNRLIGC